MTCTVAGCSRSVASAKVCRRHWEERRTERMVGGAGTLTRNGYRRVNAAVDHPLSDSYGHVLEHRLILWEKVGSADQMCHWCGRTVSWLLPQPNQSGRLVADHVNGDRLDNHPENLVPACRGCNANRDRVRDSLGRFGGRRGD